MGNRKENRWIRDAYNVGELLLDKLDYSYNMIALKIGLFVHIPRQDRKDYRKVVKELYVKGADNLGVCKAYREGLRNGKVDMRILLGVRENAFNHITDVNERTNLTDSLLRRAAYGYQITGMEKLTRNSKEFRLLGVMLDRFKNFDPLDLEYNDLEDYWRRYENVFPLCLQHTSTFRFILKTWDIEDIRKMFTKLSETKNKEKVDFKREVINHYGPITEDMIAQFDETECSMIFSRILKMVSE